VQLDVDIVPSVADKRKKCCFHLRDRDRWLHLRSDNTAFNYYSFSHPRVLMPNVKMCNFNVRDLVSEYIAATSSGWMWRKKTCVLLLPHLPCRWRPQFTSNNVVKPQKPNHIIFVLFILDLFNDDFSCQGYIASTWAAQDTFQEGGRDQKICLQTWFQKI
jgi:hypothetical protein